MTYAEFLRRSGLLPSQNALLSWLLLHCKSEQGVDIASIKAKIGDNDTCGNG